MTFPTLPTAPIPSFSFEDATEQALADAFTIAVATWLTDSANAVMSGGAVPNLSLLSDSATFAGRTVPRVRAALEDTWLRTFARTGTDLRPYIDAYLSGLANRLDGLAALANRRAGQALQEKLSTGDVRAIRDAVRQSLAPDAYDAYVRRLAASESTISVNSALHDVAMTAWQQGASVEKTWRTRNDDKVRHTHQLAEGQTVPFGAPFWVGGVPMMHPGDPSAPASEVSNCRCRARYTLGRRPR